MRKGRESERISEEEIYRHIQLSEINNTQKSINYG